MHVLPKPKNPHWFLYGYVWAAIYYLIFWLRAGKFIDPVIFVMALICSETTFLFGYYNKLPIFWFGLIGMVVGFANPTFRHLFWIAGLMAGMLVTVCQRYYKKK
jgi:hypothetical protein